MVDACGRATGWATGCGCLPAGDCLRAVACAGECGRAKQTHSLGIECGVGKFFLSAVCCQCCSNRTIVGLPAGESLRASHCGLRLRRAACATRLWAGECGQVNRPHLQQ